MEQKRVSTQSKFIGEGVITIKGKDYTINLLKVDMVNKGFSGVVIDNVFGNDIKVRNTQKNNLTLDNFKHFTLNFTFTKDKEKKEVKEI